MVEPIEQKGQWQTRRTCCSLQTEVSNGQSETSWSRNKFAIRGRQEGVRLTKVAGHVEFRRDFKRRNSRFTFQHCDIITKSSYITSDYTELCCSTHGVLYCVWTVLRMKCDNFCKRYKTLDIWTSCWKCLLPFLAARLLRKMSRICHKTPDINNKPQCERIRHLEGSWCSLLIGKPVMTNKAEVNTVQNAIKVVR